MHVRVTVLVIASALCGCAIDAAGLLAPPDAGAARDAGHVPDTGIGRRDAACDGLELCDGLDGDCDPATPDGQDDPGVNVRCDGSDADLCEEGVTVCVGGAIVCDDPTNNNHELCNGSDDDCDGTVDEEAMDAVVYYVDADGDGAGADGPTLASCMPVAGRAPAGGDCDDSDATVRPGATETCNLIDDDCDGTIDDASPSCGCLGHVYAGHVYLFCQADVVWTDAHATCGARGGHLVSFSSTAEHDFVRERVEFYDDTGWWIGFNDRSREMEWQWTDGSAVTFTAWHTDEPNDGGFLSIEAEDCAQMNVFDDRTWNDAPCDDHYPFVCEL